MGGEQILLHCQNYLYINLKSILSLKQHLLLLCYIILETTFTITRPLTCADALVI